MGTMVGFTEAKLLVLAKENTPRGRNAQKEIDRRKAQGTWQSPEGSAVKEPVETTTKPKTRRRKKAVKSEVTVKTDVEDAEQETTEGE